MHKTYLKTNSKPIGSSKPLSEKEYVYRYVYGSTKFSKDVLKRFVSESRKGYYHGFKVK